MATWRLVLCLALGLQLGVLGAQDPLVTVQQGKLRGYKLYSFKKNTIFTFSGVPYAKPPVGELRFKEPQAPEPWEGIRSAKQEGSACYQKDVLFSTSSEAVGSEDCLYLNVYSPQLPRPGHNMSALPVMVWIHGGGWLSGHGGKDIYGPDHLLDQEVVLVTLNYRLGALGFLSTEDATSPGNYGLKDQVAALRWVQNNIAVFGGDPGSVTIFGNSAGGASVHYLLLSAATRGLFQRAISQSGTAFAPWASARDPAGHARKVAALLECPQSPSEELISCLRTKDAHSLVDVMDHFLEWDIDPLLTFAPAVEPPHPGMRLIPAPVLAMVRETERLLADNIVPWMAGFTAQDGSMRTSAIARDAALLQQLNDDFEKIAPISLRTRESSSDVTGTTKQVRNFYFGEGKIDSSSLDNITNMYTDRHFLVPLMQSVNAMRAHGIERHVYLYHVTHRGRHSLTAAIDKTTSTNYGVCHMDELQYLFGMPVFFPPVPRDEKDPDHMMMSLMTMLFTNFARSGLPTSVSDEVKLSRLARKQMAAEEEDEHEIFEWDVATPEDPKFADLNPLSPRMVEAPHPRRVNLWQSIELDENGRAFSQPNTWHTEL